MSSSIDAPNRNESTNHSSDISKPDLMRTSAAVRLASYVYKQGSVEPWVNNDGFVLRAQGNTECTWSVTYTHPTLPTTKEVQTVSDTPLTILKPTPVPSQPLPLTCIL